MVPFFSFQWEPREADLSIQQSSGSCGSFGILQSSHQPPTRLLAPLETGLKPKYTKYTNVFQQTVTETVILHVWEGTDCEGAQGNV